MKRTRLIILWLSFLLLPAPGWAAAGIGKKSPQITVYNQNFAVVKESRTLELKKGENVVRETDVTAHLEPESVALRDLQTPESIRILEQNYESDPLSEGLLLQKYEGKEVVFEITNPKTGEKEIKKGRIIRSGYVPHRQAYGRYGREYEMRQTSYASATASPIIELDGKVIFGLPGKPVFDILGEEEFLKPTLLWLLWTDKAGKHDLEFSYLTGGMDWEANYNAVAPETGDLLDIIGWITIDNQSGKEFADAQIKLMAGDVSRLRSEVERREYREVNTAAEVRPEIAERAFEEYHLYTLPRNVALRDRETKQVEFIRANRVPFQRLLVYDGARIPSRQYDWDAYRIRSEVSYGTECNSKVWSMIETENTSANKLGMPLPRGKVKVYRRDTDGRNEFIGEDRIDHTPEGEKIRLYLGNVFDLIGERRQTDFQCGANWAKETFEILLRNHKKEEVEIRVVEHLYRWSNWEIQENSEGYFKKDSQTIEFLIKAPPGGEKKVAYRVYYWW